MIKYKERTMNYTTYMLFTSDLRKAKKELIDADANILVDLTDKVLLVNVPEKVDVNTLEYSAPEKPKKMDLLSNLMVEVWSSRRPQEMKDLIEKLLSDENVKITKIKNLDRLN